MRVDMDSKKVVPTNGYATAVSPIDGTVWLSVPVVNGPARRGSLFELCEFKFGIRNFKLWI
jgi:hypothetical protein